MTAILTVLALGLIAWAGTIVAGRMPRSARAPLALATMLGLTGYFVAGRPDVAAAPVTRAAPAGFGEALTDPRRGLTGRFGPEAQWLGMSDGLLRAGNSLAAAQMLEQGLRRYPRSADLWVGYGNALVAHAGGLSTPASERAFATAAAIDPAHPAPPFFTALALAQGGDLDGAERIWRQLLVRVPPGAPVRDTIAALITQAERERAQRRAR